MQVQYYYYKNVDISGQGMYYVKILCQELGFERVREREEVMSIMEKIG